MDGPDRFHHASMVYIILVPPTTPPPTPCHLWSGPKILFQQLLDSRQSQLNSLPGTDFAPSLQVAKNADHEPLPYNAMVHPLHHSNANPNNQTVLLQESGNSNNPVSLQGTTASSTTTSARPSHGPACDSTIKPR